MNTRHTKSLLIASWLLITLLCGSAFSSLWALESDRYQPISIQADEAQLSESQGLATYTGNVELQQGSLKIQCDQLIVSSDETGVNQIEAIGKPAHFEQKTATTDPKLEANAHRITYLTSKDKVLLKTNARVQQGDNLFEGDLITYDLNTQQLSAFKPDEKKGDKKKDSDDRVRMILQPSTLPAETP